MDFFSFVFKALTTNNVGLKKNIIQSLKDNFYDYKFYHESDIATLVKPSFMQVCQVIHPTRISRPKICNSDKALAKTLHAIAHIEYNAIDLGLDAAYRFRNLPQSYYLDFIELAYEEVLHYSLVESLLHDLGFEYGDFAVHDNLFCAMQQSQNLIERMALVHKGLEALGLDANPFVYKKIQQSCTPFKDKILKVLDIILHDEITHVAKGVKWLCYAQNRENDTRSFHEILGKFKDFNVIGKIPNIEARMQAGYSYDEIQNLRLYAVHDYKRNSENDKKSKNSTNQDIIFGKIQ